MFSRLSRPLPRASRGVALITALILLLVLTLVGVAAMNTVSLEQNMAGNLRDQSLALDAAEAGMRDAEIRLDAGFGMLTPATVDCTSGLCDAESGSQFTTAGFGRFEDTTHDEGFWAGVWVLGYTGTPLPAGTFSEPLPKYIIEKGEMIPFDLGTDTFSGRRYFTITARGKGGNPNSVAVVQATFAAQEN